MAARTSHGLALGVVRDGIDRNALPALDRTSADRSYVLASTLSTSFVRISPVRFSSKRRVYLFRNRGCTSVADLSRRRQMSLPGYPRQLRLWRLNWTFREYKRHKEVIPDDDVVGRTRV